MNGPPLVVVLGGTTGIGRGVAAAFARRGWEVVVTGRSREDAVRTAADLALRFGVVADGEAFDACDLTTHAAFLARITASAGDRLACVVAAFGSLGDPSSLRDTPESISDLLATNLTGVASILGHAANWFEPRRRGILVGISSVAGDRGRQSNYHYGAAKSGVTTLLAGLRNRLHRAGVHVLTVKPGFVDTEMTWGLPGLFLVADPDAVGEQIARAALRGRSVLYVPWFWRWIMLAIRLVPEAVFKRLRL